MKKKPRGNYWKKQACKLQAYKEWQDHGDHKKAALDNGITPRTLLNHISLQSDAKNVRLRQGNRDGKALERDILLEVMVANATPGKRYTFEEIGQVIGVSRERIRQIQESALKKLRKYSLGDDSILNEILTSR